MAKLVECKLCEGDGYVCWNCQAPVSLCECQELASAASPSASLIQRLTQYTDGVSLLIENAAGLARCMRLGDLKMPNPICTEMGWPVPKNGERLVISTGVGIAYLFPGDAETYEGVYLANPGYGMPNACFSAAFNRRGDAIRAGLAKKLFANARNLKKGELAALVGRLSSCRVWIE